MGATESRLHQLLSIALAIAFTVSLVSAAGITAGTNEGHGYDYRINSVDEFDYYNSRGFEDTNGDGKVVVVISSMIDLSQSRDQTVHYGGDIPFVLRGDGGFVNGTAPLLEFGETSVRDDLEQQSDSPVTIEGISIVNFHGIDNGWRNDVFELGGPVVLRDIRVRDTTPVLQTKDDVRIVDSEFADTGQVVRTERRVTVDNTRIRNASTGENGIISADGRASLADTVVRNVSGSRGGAVSAETVTATNVTIRKVSAVFSGGAINAESGVRIDDSVIARATADRNGGAVATDGSIHIANSVLTNVSSGQDSSLFGFKKLKIYNSRIEHADPMQYALGGISSATVSVVESTFVDTSRIQAADVRFTNSTVRSTRGILVKALDVEFRRSTLQDSAGIVASDIHVSYSTLRNVSQINSRTSGSSVTVRNSSLVFFGQFKSGNEYWTLRLSDSVIHGADSPLVPDVNHQSIRRVNFIEVEPPVFAGPLPNKSLVFVDTTNDTEPVGEWTPDVFWSRDTPFDSLDRLPKSALQTATPTPTATITASSSKTGTATATSGAVKTTRTATSEGTTVPGRGETAGSTPEGGIPTGSVPGFGIPLTVLAGIAGLYVIRRRRRS